MNVRSIKQVVAAGLVASGLAACADAPTAARMPSVGAPNLAFNATPVIVSAAQLQMVEEKFAVCKVFTGSNLAYPKADFRADVYGFLGVFQFTKTFSLNNGECADLGTIGGAGYNITVTETAIPNYTTAWQIDTFGVGGLLGTGPLTSGNVGYGSAYGNRNNQGIAIGTKMTFTNTYVPPAGCTFTQGYWKTHSSKGPAPYDDNWTTVGGADATFFLSGTSWYNVFWTPPAGNAYYNLAHQYMAAKLNVNNGASTPANVASAITAAEALFAAYTPAQVAALARNSSVRAQFISLAGTLGSYNEGLTGPGHCGDLDQPSDT